MRTYKKVRKTQRVLDSVTCDCCKKVIDSEDVLELQEMLHINFTGGFGSIFGDMSSIEGDFCQTCVKLLLGKYLRDVTPVDDLD